MITERFRGGRQFLNRVGGTLLSPRLQQSAPHDFWSGSHAGLGQFEAEFETAAAVLGYNYPGSSWYQASYDLLKGKHLEPKKSSGSWLSNIF